MNHTLTSSGALDNAARESAARAPPFPKEHVLAKLYYQLGKQTTDFALQNSHKEGDETIWTKRRTFLDLDPQNDQWFIQSCNHRQILKNEIILDFDRPIPPEKVLEDYDVRRIVARLISEDWRFCVYHSGSKGVHIHIYFDGLARITADRREDFREQLIREYRKELMAGLDILKASDKTMIALEHTPHWKTGVPKTLLLNHGVTPWKKI